MNFNSLSFLSTFSKQLSSDGAITVYRGGGIKFIEESEGVILHLPLFRGGCPVRCSGCVIGAQSAQRIPIEFYNVVVKEFDPETVIFDVNGEPTSCKYLHEVLEALKGRRILLYTILPSSCDPEPMLRLCVDHELVTPVLSLHPQGGVGGIENHDPVAWGKEFHSRTGRFPITNTAIPSDGGKDLEKLFSKVPLEWEAILTPMYAVCDGIVSHTPIEVVEAAAKLLRSTGRRVFINFYSSALEVGAVSGLS